MTESDAEKAARQVAWALLRQGQETFTYDELRARHARFDEAEPLDWTGVIADFLERGYAQIDDARYRLTAAGRAHVDGLRGEDFGEELIRTDESTVYGRFCDLLYGKDLGQYSMVTMDQLTKLIEVLELGDRNQVLDLGCGVGRITEYLSDVSGAHVTGLDFAGPAIRRAQERTGGKAARLTFLQGSMNALALPAASFDTVLSLDTLYFADDLEATLRGLKALLRTPGQMGLFWSQMQRDGEEPEQLQPEGTRLARALTAAGLAFETHEYTAEEKQHWRRGMEVVEALKADFEAEGSMHLYEGRVKETRTTLEFIERDRISRYLYHVRL